MMIGLEKPARASAGVSTPPSSKTITAHRATMSERHLPQAKATGARRRTISVSVISGRCVRRLLDTELLDDWTFHCQKETSWSAERRLLGPSKGSVGWFNKRKSLWDKYIELTWSKDRTSKVRQQKNFPKRCNSNPHSTQAAWVVTIRVKKTANRSGTRKPAIWSDPRS